MMSVLNSYLNNFIRRVLKLDYCRSSLVCCCNVSDFRFRKAEKPVGAKSRLPFKRIYNGRSDCDTNNNAVAGIISEDLISLSQSNNERRNMESSPSLSCQGELLFGLYPVYLALKQQRRRFYQLFIKKDLSRSLIFSKAEIKEEIRNMAIDLGVKVTTVTSRSLTSLVQGRVHQGVCLDASNYPLLKYTEEKESDQCSSTTINPPPLWLVLNEIQDPMNMGAIFRSAYYFGVDKIFLPEYNSCSLSPVVSKASSGALEVLNIFQLQDLMTFLKDRKENGWCLVSTTAYESSQTESHVQCKMLNLPDFRLTQPTILILGNESKGISSDIQSLCSQQLCIFPTHSIHPSMDSLNVSVATGIILYHMLYGRKFGTP